MSARDRVKVSGPRVCERELTYGGDGCADEPEDEEDEEADHLA